MLRDRRRSPDACAARARRGSRATRASGARRRRSALAGRRAGRSAPTPGACGGHRFSKNDSPSTPLGQRTSVDGPAGQVREHHRRDPGVVVDDVGFREARRRGRGPCRGWRAVRRRMVRRLDGDLDHRLGRAVPSVCEPICMPSAIWTGPISFGLVSVPVKLVSATKSKDVRFNQLEEGTGARIRYRKVSDATGEEVSDDEHRQGLRGLEGPVRRRRATTRSKSLAPKASHDDRDRGLRRPRPRSTRSTSSSPTTSCPTSSGASPTGCSSRR